VPLPGLTERNIFHQAPRRGTTAVSSAGGNSSAGQPDDPSFKRHGDEITAQLIAEAYLYTVTVKEKRGSTKRVDIQRSNPSGAFRSYYKEILRRTNRAKGFPLSATLGGAIVHFDDVPEDKRFRRSAELDYDQFPDNIRTAMHGTYRDCISDEELGLLETDEGFLDWCDHMNRVALRSVAEGNWNPRSRDQRENAPPVKKIKSTGTRSASGTSVPLSSLPGYAELRRQVDNDNRNAAMARSAASRGSSSRSNVPSDGQGCDYCGGNHYARHCPARAASPYARR